MSKFKVGDRVGFSHSNKVLKQTYHGEIAYVLERNASKYYYAIRYLEGELDQYLFMENEIELIPESTIPRYEIEKLAARLKERTQYYIHEERKQGYLLSYEAVKEILDKYKES